MKQYKIYTFIHDENKESAFNNFKMMLKSGQIGEENFGIEEVEE